MTRFPEPDPSRSARYRAAGQWRDETIWDRIAESIAAHDTKTAVVDAAGVGITYGDLDEQSARVAGFLSARGVGPGDVVTVCLPNRTDAVVVVVGVIRAGAVVNPLPPANGPSEISHVLRTCGSRVLFLPDTFRRRDYVDVAGRLDADAMAACHVVHMGGRGAPTASTWVDVLGATPLAKPPTHAADDPVAVLFTSGTESKAKGAVHTSNTVLFGERAFGAALSISSADVAFMASPITHTTGFMHGIVMTLTTGGTLSLLDVWDGEIAIDLMAEHGCTWTMGATPFLADSVEVLERGDRSLPDLRYFLCGGAPIPEALARRADALGVRVLSIYGATESPPHTLVHPEDPAENAWLTDGRPLAGIEIRITTPEGGDVEPGEEGEEWSRGPNTFLGYLGPPELTARVLDEDGWYHSGDLVRQLADGSVRVTGRLKDIIVRGGYNISVREIEELILDLPHVNAVAVVGTPDPRLGERSCAVVVPEDGQRITLEDVVESLKDKGIATHKLPERLESWDELPMNPSGKIQRFKIREALLEDQT